MPNPNQRPAHIDNARFSEMLKSVPVMGDSGLAHEVAELRKEIAALRAELSPVPSLLLTGQQALNEFKQILRNGQ